MQCLLKTATVELICNSLLTRGYRSRGLGNKAGASGRTQGGSQFHTISVEQKTSYGLMCYSYHTVYMQHRTHLIVVPA